MTADQSRDLIVGQRVLGFEVTVLLEQSRRRIGVG